MTVRSMAVQRPSSATAIMRYSCCIFFPFASYQRYLHLEQEIQLYAAGLDSASKAAKTIILFLTQRSVDKPFGEPCGNDYTSTRSGKGKATKNSNEAEYRAIFDNLIADLLTVLYWPEWPAAGLLLRIICRFMVRARHGSSSSTVRFTSR